MYIFTDGGVDIGSICAQIIDGLSVTLSDFGRHPLDCLIAAPDCVATVPQCYSLLKYLGDDRLAVSRPDFRTGKGIRLVRDILSRDRNGIFDHPKKCATTPSVGDIKTLSEEEALDETYKATAEFASLGFNPLFCVDRTLGNIDDATSLNRAHYHIRY